MNRKDRPAMSTRPVEDGPASVMWDCACGEYGIDLESLQMHAAAEPAHRVEASVGPFTRWQTWKIRARWFLRGVIVR